MTQYNFTLRSTDLLSKYGFGDGDQFSDFIIDKNYHVNWTTQEFAMDKEVLKRAVERYLLPALPVPVRLQCFLTQHNNVRVHVEDYRNLEAQPETIVELTEQQLRDICEEVKHEYLKES
jgi:hypothetical protein